METENLIFTTSGIRGIFGKDLTLDIAKKIAIAFGLWLPDKRVIIGRDTRPSGLELEKVIIEGLIAADCKVINLSICPTPAIIFKKNQLNIPAGIIISGSHNPPEWNALKLLFGTTFLSNSELDQISEILKNISLNDYRSINPEKIKSIEKIDAIQDYIQAIYKKFDVEKIKEKNKLKVVVDTGAGAGKYITPQLLEGLGCEVKLVNNDLYIDNDFPRGIEPIEKNLKDLIMIIWRGKYDIGFAHDCDADRLAIIGDDYRWYPEDISLALITKFSLEKFKKIDRKTIFVTNIASSLIFEELAKEYNAEVIRTPIGERYLAETMEDLIKKESSESRETIIFGGEGSCGGIMDPYFNNARDGIYAAAKIIELLVETGEKISNLVAKLPKFYSFREKIEYPKKEISQIIKMVKKELISEGEIVQEIGNDLRFGEGNEWFTLIHPSNTEPIIRVISEAKRESLARVFCETTAELVRMIISKI